MGGVKFSISSKGLSLKAQGVSLKASFQGAELSPLEGGGVFKAIPSGRPEASVSRRRLFAGSAKESSFSWRTPEGVALTWRVAIHESLPAALAGASVGNFTGKALRLKSVSLLSSSSFVCEGDPSAWHLSSLGETGCAGSLAERLPSSNQRIIEMWKGYGMPVPNELPSDEYHADGSWRCFKDFMTLYTDSGRTGLCLAAVGEPRSFADLRCKCSPEGLRLEADAEMSEIVLEPGQWREAQEIAIIPMPYASALDLSMRWLASTHGARTSRKPPVGWCSWYSRGSTVTAEDVLKVAEAAAKGCSRIPMDYIQIDDGFQKTVGDWSLNEKFACGWKPIMERIRAAGSAPGIWLAPLPVHESTQVFKEHPAWFQRDSKGELAGEAGNWGPRSRWLDPTHPGSRGFIRELMRSFRAEGFEYFKIDFNTLCEETRFHDSSQTRLQVYRSLYSLYREEIGEGAYLLSCSGFTRGTVGFADGSRIGPDSCSSWRAPHPCCIAECFKTAGSTSFANRILYANDPDVSYLGPAGKLSQDEWRSWHSYVGVLGGFAMVSDLIDRQPASERLRSLEILIPPAPEPGRSLKGAVDAEHRELGFVSRRPWGVSATMTAYNSSALPRDWSFDLSFLEGLPSEGHFFVWSFWDERAWKLDGSALKVKGVPSHACSLLRITPASSAKEPLFIGSNLHVSCGSAELADFKCSAGRLEISLASEAGASEGALFLAHQGKLSAEGSEGLELASVEESSPGIWRVSVKGRRRDARQLLKLSFR